MLYDGKQNEALFLYRIAMRKKSKQNIHSRELMVGANQRVKF
jgi:hypothetical protein